MSNQKNTAPSKPKRRGTNLDRSFPVGIILLLMLALVVFLQVISAWKIMKIEREKAILETEKKNYAYIKKELPTLRKESGELKREHLELQGEVAGLESVLIKGKKELQENNTRNAEIISESKRFEILLNDFKKQTLEKETQIVEARKMLNRLLEQINSRKLEIEQGTADLNGIRDNIEKNKEERRILQSEIKSLELSKLSAANSNMEKVINDLKTIQDMSKEQLDLAIKRFSDAADTITKSISGVENEASNFRTLTNQAANKIQVSADEFIKTNSSIEETSEQLRESLVNVSEQLANLKTWQHEIMEMLKEFKNLRQQITQDTDMLNAERLKLKQALDKLSTTIVSESKKKSQD